MAPSYALMPGDFEPSYLDFSAALEQMRAMRDEANSTAQAVRQATSELRQGVTDIAEPLSQVSPYTDTQDMVGVQAAALGEQGVGLAPFADVDLGASLEPIGAGFASVTRAALAGQGRVGEAWRAMGRELIAQTVRSHIEGLLSGAEHGSLLSMIYGERGQGGGLSGLARRYIFGEPGQVDAQASLSGAPFTQTLDQLPVFESYAMPEGMPANLGTAPLSELGTQVLGAESEPASSLSQQFTELNQAITGLPENFNQLATSTSQLPSLFESLGNSFSSVLGSFGSEGGGIGGLFSGFMGIGGLLGFEKGGIVPSAAGGMIVGPGHGTLAMLHPREMVLPAHISTGLQRIIGDATGPTASHNVNVNYHVNALDARGVRELLMEHGDTITNIIQRSLRDSPRGGSGFVIS